MHIFVKSKCKEYMIELKYKSDIRRFRGTQDIFLCVDTKDIACRLPGGLFFYTS